MKQPEIKNEWSAPTSCDRGSVVWDKIATQKHPTSRGASASAIADRMRWAMAKCRISYRKLGDAVGCSHAMVHYIAKGRNGLTNGPVMTSVTTMELFAQQLGVNPEWLTFGLGLPTDGKSRSHPSWMMDYYAKDAESHSEIQVTLPPTEPGPPPKEAKKTTKAQKRKG